MSKETIDSIKKSLEKSVDNKYGRNIVIENGVDIVSKSEGYLGAIDFDRLKVVLEDFSGKMSIPKLIGEHIIEGDVLAKLDIHSELEEDVYEDVLNCFIIESTQVVMSDYR